MDGSLAPLDRRRRHVAGHGPLQLAGPLGRPPLWRPVADPCAASFAGGAERPDVVPGPPAHAHHRFRARHGARARADRCPPLGACPHHRVRLLGHAPAHECALVVRAARTGRGQPRVPPAAPHGGGTPRGQPRGRPHRVGRTGRQGPLPGAPRRALPDRPGRSAGPGGAGGHGGRPVRLLGRQLAQPFSAA